jgi:DNA replication licensing factor MCM3
MENKIINQDLTLFKNYFRIFIKKYSLFKNKIKNSKRILVPLESLWKFSPFLAQNLLKKPFIYIPILEQFLNEFYYSFQDKKNSKIKFALGLKRSMNKKFTSPKMLNARFIGEIVFIEGLVVNCSKKRVKLKKSVYYSIKSQKLFIQKTCQKIDNFFFLNKIKNSENQFLELEYGLSTFIDCQNVIIQDFPETLYNGQSPRNINVLLEDDLINSCKIGQRIKLCGIYQPLEYADSKIKTNFFTTGITCLSVSADIKYSSVNYLKCDVILMKNFSLLIDSFERLASLIAPCVFGELLIKKGIILFLIGRTNNKTNKYSFMKDNINILLVGDSCVHKTTFLQFVANFLPNSTFITLKNNFINELSIRIKKDINETTDFSIPSSFFINNNQTICIDGIENISEYDKYILNDILEYPKIYTPKESSLYNLKNGCGLIAAANSIFGYYDYKKSIQININLQKSLIYKFDLIFLLLDTINNKKDKKLATHVINHNCYSKNKKYNLKEEKDLFNDFFEIEKSSINFIKIFINFSKNVCFPRLDDEAISYILTGYMKMRFSDKKKKIVKIKYIESLINLTLIYAKTHLRAIAQKEDAEYINNYLAEITKNNQTIENKKEIKKNEILKKSKSIYSLKNEKFFISKTKTEESPFIESNKIKISKFLFPLKNIRLINDFKFSFFKIKAILVNKHKNSYFERSLSEWLKNEKCLIFKKILIRT